MTVDVFFSEAVDLGLEALALEASGVSCGDFSHDLPDQAHFSCPGGTAGPFALTISGAVTSKAGQTVAPGTVLSSEMQSFQDLNGCVRYKAALTE